MAQSQFYGWPVNLDEAQLGRHATSVLSFYGVTATVQPTHAQQANVATATLTQVLQTVAIVDLAARVSAVCQLANALRDALVSIGAIKGS